VEVLRDLEFRKHDAVDAQWFRTVIDDAVACESGSRRGLDLPFAAALFRGVHGRPFGEVKTQTCENGVKKIPSLTSLTRVLNFVVHAQARRAGYRVSKHRISRTVRRFRRNNGRSWIFPGLNGSARLVLVVEA